MLVDLTIVDRFFVALGGGIGSQDPGFLSRGTGPALHFRLGGVGVEGRTLIIPQGAAFGGTGPLGEIIATVGYEAF